MTLVILLKLLGGFVLLTAGAEFLVRGASRLAAALGITPLVIGLTIVAMGTSSPELAVSVNSAWTGQADLALGNVVGSNIFNILLILGLSAAVTPLVVSSQVIRRDVPLMIGLSFVCYLQCLDGVLSRWDGIVLLLAGVAYTWWCVREGRRETQAIQKEAEAAYGIGPQSRSTGRLLQVVFVVVGLLMLMGGARWLVQAAVATAHSLGISELVIGLTIVAIGTSLPELATSVMAAIHGERDIAVGNVVGSNILNIAVVLGLSAFVSSTGVRVSPNLLKSDMPVMLGVALACMPIVFSGARVNRWEGWLLLTYGAAYVWFLVLSAKNSPALAVAQNVMAVLIPASLLLVLFGAMFSFKSSRRGRAS